MATSEFTSPDDLYAFIDGLIEQLRENRLDPEPLEQIQSSVYTTSSEWLGELGVAIREVQQQEIQDQSIVRGLDRVMRAVKKTWPRL